MILVRTKYKGRYDCMRLKECGLEWRERFSFYDQVHCTGTDIKQVYDAKAGASVVSCALSLFSPQPPPSTKSCPLFFVCSLVFAFAFFFFS